MLHSTNTHLVKVNPVAKSPVHAAPEKTPEVEVEPLSEDRFELAAEIMDDPQKVAPSPKGFLQSAWSSVCDVTSDLVSSLFLPKIPPHPEATTREIGQMEVDSWKESYGVTQDEKLESQLEGLVDRAAETHGYKGDLDLVVLDTEERIGSSLPAKKDTVIFSRGMLESHSDGELLYVAGHEIGHLVRGHDAQRYALEDKLAEASGPGESKSFKAKLLEERLEEFHHNAEFEADVDGVKTLRDSGKTAEPAVSFLVGTEEEETSTHPASESRIWEIVKPDDS